MKPTVAVFTAWPDSVNDLYDVYDIKVLEPVDQLLQETFASTTIDQGLLRYVVRAHDRQFYLEYDYCVFVQTSEKFDLWQVIQQVDGEHTTYESQETKLVLYRRQKIWQAKNITVDFYNEQAPDDVGIIFIDCWDIIQTHSKWIHTPDGFDFYGAMIKTLQKYPTKNLVFHTGNFGSFPLSRALKTLYSQGNAVDIMNINYFSRHYQARNLYNWIVVGAHWQRCTHEKPLGFYNLLDLKKIDSKLRVFSHMTCTVKFTNNNIDDPEVGICTQKDYDKDSLVWRPNGYLPELVGP
jgi:hypothetical protein